MTNELYAINVKRVWIKDPHDLAKNYDKLVEDEAFRVVVLDTRAKAIEYAKRYLFDLFVSELNTTTMLLEINDLTDTNQLILFTFLLCDKNNERTVDYEVSLKRVALH